MRAIPEICNKIHMQNVVATFNLVVSQINLYDLSMRTTYVEHNPKKFAAEANPDYLTDLLYQFDASSTGKAYSTPLPPTVYTV